VKKRRNAISGAFAPRLIEMLESPAYRVLSSAARQVLDRIEIEHAHHGGAENGALPVAYDHFEEYGLHSKAIAPAIREVCALGFVEVMQRGCGGNAYLRRVTLYRLTYRNAKGEAGDGTHEWRKIKTIEEAEAIAKKARAEKDQRAVAIGERAASKSSRGREPALEAIKSPGPETAPGENRIPGPVSAGVRGRFPAPKRQKSGAENRPYQPGAETGPTSISRAGIGGEKPLAKRASQGAVANERLLSGLPVNGSTDDPGLAAAIGKLGARILTHITAEVA